MADKKKSKGCDAKIPGNGYKKTESWDEESIKELASIYKRVLTLLGEDPGREGLLKTPERVAKVDAFSDNGLFY